MLENPQFLADRLLQESGRVVNFFNQLLPDQWSIIVYREEDEWSFHHLLAHFVSAEIARRELIMDVCNLGEGAPSEFDTGRFNRSEVEQFVNFSPKILISRFIDERGELAKFVSKLTAEDLQKVGNDPFLGLAPVSEMITLTYRHLQVHLREVRRFIK